jgi:hypothetical protein
MRTEFQGTRNNGQGPAGRRPSTRGSIPAYILFPAGFFGGSIVFTYWYFQDEAPFTKRRRILATVSFLSFIEKLVYVFNWYSPSSTVLLLHLSLELRIAYGAMSPFTRWID